MESSHNTTSGYYPPDHTPEPDPQTAQASKEKHKRLFQRGLVCLGIGILLMAISFLINMVMFQADHDFSVAMYTLTSAGAVLILYALGCMLGF